MDHYYDKIPGWFNFSFVYDKAVSSFNDGSVFVEIGSWLGTSVAYLGVELINAGKLKTKIYCIDTWGENDDGEYLHEQVVKNKTLYENFLKNIQPLKDAGLEVHAIKSKSQDASNLFESKSLDFVYVDGSHLYENVKKDIQLYIPKMKSGGLFAGHDWQCSDVKRAVLEEISSDKISLSNNSWYTTIFNDDTKH